MTPKETLIQIADEIRSLQRQISNNSKVISETNTFIRRIEADIAQQIADNKELKNEQQRKAAMVQMLASDLVYVGHQNTITHAQAEIGNLQIETGHQRRLYEIELADFSRTPGVVIQAQG